MPVIEVEEPKSEQDASTDKVEGKEATPVDAKSESE